MSASKPMHTEVALAAPVVSYRYSADGMLVKEAN